MHQIEIDDSVLTYLQNNAIPFVDTPNSTLRRLLRIDVPKQDGLSQLETGNSPKPLVDIEKLKAEICDEFGSYDGKARTKQQKANLQELTKAGSIKPNEKLYLVDYKGIKVPGYEATVSGNLLVWNGQHYSMSHLARELFKKLGYTSDAVRGPVHWCNSSGVTVSSLWKEFLKSTK